MLINRALIALALASLAAGPGVTPAAAKAPARAPAAAERAVLVLAQGWRFKLDPATAGPEQPGYDDSAWAQVAVPHSWNRVG